MSESPTYDTGAPSMEVRVFRDGELIARELCESEDEANLIVERYADEMGMSFEVEELGKEPLQEEILGSPSIGFDDGYEAEEPVLPEQEGAR